KSRGLSDDAVDPLVTNLLGGDLKPELFLQGSSEEPAHGVSPPAGALDNLGDGRAFSAPEHGDYLRLLRAVAALARSGRVRARRRLLLPAIPSLRPGLDRRLLGARGRAGGRLAR